MKGALMVCGTASDAGKSVVVAGLCRWLRRQGASVAPFKAQNMALNSYVTAEGGEIGRAQAMQAMACGIEPEVAMNPILLKPTGEQLTQVIVGGRPVGEMSAADYQRGKGRYREVVLSAFDDVSSRFDVVVCEGAGSPAEINLADRDIVNLGLAVERDVPALLVGDIERGGVFAHLWGTVALLPEERRLLVKGFVINKFRGDPALLVSGVEELTALTGTRNLGVLPYVAGLGGDAEDSLALARWSDTRWAEARGAFALPGLSLDPEAGQARIRDAVACPGPILDVAMVRLPRISNFTDVDPLCMEPSVRVRLVADARSLGTPDLVVLPGTKATVHDLHWMESTGILDALRCAHREGSVVLGICGGYQMLGTKIDDSVESKEGVVEGTGLLEAETAFEDVKVTSQRHGIAGRWCLGAPAITGFEIHHGRVEPRGDVMPFAHFDCGDEGMVAANRRVYGTNLHGLFEEDAFRSGFLFALAETRQTVFHSSGLSFTKAREARFELLADLVEEHLDTGGIAEIIEAGA